MSPAQISLEIVCGAPTFLFVFKSSSIVENKDTASGREDNVHCHFFWLLVSAPSVDADCKRLTSEVG